MPNDIRTEHSLIYFRHIKVSWVNGYGFHGNKSTVLYLIVRYYSLSVLSAKLYFLEIDPVHQKLWSFKCTMLKTLNSNFIEWHSISSSTDVSTFNGRNLPQKILIVIHVESFPVNDCCRQTNGRL